MPKTQRIEEALEGITEKYVRDHGGCPASAPATVSAGGPRRTPAPHRRPRARWSSCACGGTLPRSGASAYAWSTGSFSVAGQAIQVRVDTALAAVDVDAVVFTVRNASPAATSWPKPAGTCWRPCLAAHSRPASTATSPPVLWSATAVSSPCPRKAGGPRPRISSPAPSTLPGGPRAPMGSRRRSRAGTSGPVSPASRSRTRSAPPSPRRPYGTKLRTRPRRPYGTKHRPPSTNRTGTLLELRRSGPPPSTFINGAGPYVCGRRRVCRPRASHAVRDRAAERAAKSPRGRYRDAVGAHAPEAAGSGEGLRVDRAAA